MGVRTDREGRPVPAQSRSARRAGELDTVLALASEAVLRLDGTGAVTSLNRAAERLLGAVETRLRGSTPADHMLREDHDRWRRALDDVRAGAVVRDVHVRFRRPDRQIVDAVVSAAPARSRAGIADGMWVVAADVTEQHLAQRTLADCEARVRRSEELAGTGSFAVDTVADVVQWSLGMHHVFGVRPGEFVPSVDAHLALVHPDDRPAVRELLSGVLAGSAERGELDHRVVRPTGGTLAWVFLAVEAVRGPGGEALGARGVCQDVTQRKESELTKEAFLSTVSHELRTPLTAVLGFAAALRDLVPAEQAALVEPIVRNSLEMRAMIERLLDHTRLEANGVTVEPRVVRLAEHVQACLRQLEVALAGRDVSVEVADDLMVWADPAALDRILGNLIGNAAKYSDPPAPIAVSADLQPDGVVVSVRDEGPGISAEDQARVFDRYFRAQNGTAAKVGSGVRLSIAREYVELHGGRIWVESAPREGATFRFMLPRPEEVP